MIFNPAEVGWHLGRAHEPRGGQLWVPWDRTAGVIGPQGSGKTLDLLIPALLGASGAALVTLTKVDDLLLSFPVRSRDGRPSLVLDPFGLAGGLPELVWDPIAGCVDPMLAERRAKAFTAGTIKAAMGGGYGDDAARFYAAEAAKVIQAFFHAAALTGRSLDDVLRWVANPTIAGEPGEILLQHPHAAPYWLGLLHGALQGDDRTAGNTITTIQQAMSLFFQEQIRRRCVPSPGRPATDVAEVIRRGGTIYLLGREDPYASASPLMTAVAEQVLDIALSRWRTRRRGAGCAHPCWPA
jgi:type IV secretion system protein VirD4